uniref:F-box domain-containing protein n=1 Tax=Mycena chlorophos TaxID=658473 RepID=A0ABQ0KVY4_MYCCL|nr:predicted protein [Mycena chlorophos]
MVLRLATELSASTRTKPLRLEEDQQIPLHLNDLPPELMAEIFLRYLPPYPLRPPLTGRGSAIFLLGISRKWRAIALQSPLLWRAAMFRCVKTEEDALRFWFERSGNALLSLQVNTRALDNKEWHDTTHTDALLALIRAHRSRWQYMEFVVSLNDVDAIDGPAPNLIRLEVMSVSSSGFRYLTKTNTFRVHDAPLLRSLSMENIDSTVDSVPFQDLSSLALFGVVLDRYIPILQTAANLTHCKLILTGAFIRQSETRSVHLPLLEVFIIDTAFEYDMLQQDCLRHFTLPCLRKLEITECFFGIYTDSAIQLGELIERSGCTLQRLRVTSDRQTSEPPIAVAACRIAFPGIIVQAHKPGSAAYDYHEWRMEEYWEKTWF